MGLANKGWVRGEPQDGGWIGWMIKPLGRWSLIMEIDEGFAVGMSPAELSAENKGWVRGEPQDGGWIGWMIKPLGRWSLIMEIDEGFAVGMSPAELSAEHLLSKLWLWEGKAES